MYRSFCLVKPLSCMNLHIVEMSTSSSNTFSSSFWISWSSTPGFSTTRCRMSTCAVDVSFLYALSLGYAFFLTLPEVRNLYCIQLTVDLSTPKFWATCSWFNSRATVCRTICHCRSSLYALHQPGAHDVMTIQTYVQIYYLQCGRYKLWPQIQI